MPNIQIEDLMRRPRGLSYRWAPVLFQPVHYSPERLIIGIVVADSNEAHLLQANRLDKFECLFGSNAEDAILAARVALDSLSARLTENGPSLLQSFASAVSGVTIGDLREAEGDSWKSIAERWFSAISAMFEPNVYEFHDLALTNSLPAVAISGVYYPTPRERLPLLVMEYVLDEKPTLKPYFNQRLVAGHTRRRSAHEPSIDFAGSHTVANFGTLFANRVSSVDRIKRRMWDLKVQKESETSSILLRNHEMIVQYPEKSDPQVSEGQFRSIKEALTVLESEADINEIRLRALNSIKQIGDHLIKAEAA
jgi:hypothetical protein